MKFAVVVPCLNEEAFIEPCLRSLLDSMPPDGRIYVADGGSDDETVARVNRMSTADERIQVVNNPGRLQSAAVNLVAKLLKHKVSLLVRADAHSLYPPGFLQMLVAEYEARKPASIVIPMMAEGRYCLQKAIAAAQNDLLGNGGSAHRMGQLDSRYVDHGHHALFDLTAFHAVGGYDESFRYNEDAEFDVRLNRAGGRIWLYAPATIRYFPRSSLRALMRQYWNYGEGRAHNIVKHGLKPKLRQLLPAVALLANAAALMAALAWTPFLIIPAFYVAGCITWGIVAAFRQKDWCVTASGVASIVMHMSWAAGLLYGLCKHRSQTQPKRFRASPQSTT